MQLRTQFRTRFILLFKLFDVQLTLFRSNTAVGDVAMQSDAGFVHVPFIRIPGWRRLHGIVMCY